MRWLLAAEADQIQDLIFRCTHLREVVGGSQLLTRFCQEGATELLERHGGKASDLIIHDGGAFRIAFDSAERGTAYGRDLAELYRCTIGGVLTVAEPVKWNGDFADASRAAQRALREAKSRGDAPTSVVHLPYVALCASCGIGLATERGRRHADQRPNYLCADCSSKTHERYWGGGEFLDWFRKAVDRDVSLRPDRDDWLKAVGGLDVTGRHYVAYLLADGNGMGATFRACQVPDTMAQLSVALRNVMRDALAEPCQRAVDRIRVRDPNYSSLPLLPLILGGDDLFALLPASWSIDLSRLFCRGYEQGLAKVAKELGLGDLRPTVAAAVVICKANYPHVLAHRQGAEILNRSKRMARGLEAHPESSRRLRASALTFTVVSGSGTPLPSPGRQPRYRPTAAPYFVRPQPGEAGLPVDILLQQRLNLATSLPGKRRAEFERLFHDLAVLPDDRLELTWNRRCAALLARIQGGKVSLGEAVLEALSQLGGTKEGTMDYLRDFDRPFGDGFQGNGFADLLELWDYCYDVSEDLSKYEET